MKPDYSFRNINLWNIDCMKFMKDIPDNYYELCICDPPYGIGTSKIKNWSTSDKCFSKSNEYTVKEWDNAIPEKAYFEELLRISENQIIWGGNYFANLLENSSCWIIWDKKNDGTLTADCELAWTSFDTAVRMFRFMWRGCLRDEKIKKIHLCQKPVELYKWLLTKYAKKGDKIFDSHGGSFSLACACLDLGFSFDGTEIDKEYFDNAVKRIKNHNQEFLSL